jgi:hypothetical protein
MDAPPFDDQNARRCYKYVNERAKKILVPCPGTNGIKYTCRNHDPYRDGFSLFEGATVKKFPKGFLCEMFDCVHPKDHQKYWDKYRSIFRREWRNAQLEEKKEHQLEGIARRAANLWLLGEVESLTANNKG